MKLDNVTMDVTTYSYNKDVNKNIVILDLPFFSLQNKTHSTDLRAMHDRTSFEQ